MGRVHAALAGYPVIAAVRDQEGLERAVHSPVTVVFILRACLADLGARVALCRDHGKLPFVHLDMVAGLGRDQPALEFVAAAVKPEGVITTKPSLVKPAKEAGLVAVERIFLVDSLSIQTGTKMALARRPDFVEVMPGAMPEVIAGIRRALPLPLIAGGMVTTKEQIISLVRAGVTAVSTSKADLWGV